MTRTTRAAVTRTPAMSCRAWSRFKRSMIASLSERPREALSDENDPEGEGRHQVEVPHPVRRLGTEFGDGHGRMLPHRCAGGHLAAAARSQTRRGSRRGGAGLDTPARRQAELAARTGRVGPAARAAEAGAAG